MGAGQFQYRPTGSPWTFTGGAGISGNGSGFTAGNPPAPRGRPGRLPPGDRLVQPDGRRLGRRHLPADLLRRPAGQLPGVAAGLPRAGRRRRGGHLHALGHVVPGLHDRRVHGRRRVAHDHVPGPGHRRRRQHRLRRRRRRDPGQPAAIGPTPGSSRWRWAAGQFQYRPTGSPWTFTGGAGIAGNGSGFTAGNPPAPRGRPGRLPPGDRLVQPGGRRLGRRLLRADLPAPPSGATTRRRGRTSASWSTASWSAPSRPPGTSYQVLHHRRVHGHRRVAHDHVPGPGQRRRRQHRLRRRRSPPVSLAAIADAAPTPTATVPSQFRRPANGCAPGRVVPAAPALAANGSGFTAWQPGRPRRATQVAFLPGRPARSARRSPAGPPAPTC